MYNMEHFILQIIPQRVPRKDHSRDTRKLTKGDCTWPINTLKFQLPDSSMNVHFSLSEMRRRNNLYWWGKMEIYMHLVGCTWYNLSKDVLNIHVFRFWEACMPFSLWNSTYWNLMSGNNYEFVQRFSYRDCSPRPHGVIYESKKTEYILSKRRNQLVYYDALAQWDSIQ